MRPSRTLAKHKWTREGEERKHFIQWESPPAYQVKDSWQTNKPAEACSPSPSAVEFFFSSFFFLNAHLFGIDGVSKKNNKKKNL